MALDGIYSIPLEAFSVEDPRKTRNRLAQRKLRRKRAMGATTARNHIDQQSEARSSSAHPVPPDIVEAGGSQPDDMPVRTPGSSLDMALPAWNNQSSTDLEDVNSFIPSTSSMDLTLIGEEPRPLGPVSPPKLARSLSAKHSQKTLRALRSQFQAFWSSQGIGFIPPPLSMPEPLLHSAARRNNCQIIKLLLEAGADINARDGAGRTPLLAAAENWQCDVVILLLEMGTDINAHDDEGRTVLSMAVKNSCETGVDLFLRHGADPMLGSSDLLRSTHSGFSHGHRVIEQ